MSAVGEGSLVYGLGSERPGADPEEWFRPMVWDGSTTVGLDLDEGSACGGGGAFNQAGDALVIQVMPSWRETTGGWQLFRLREGRWERSGPVLKNSWLKAPPRALSPDGAVAYTALEGGLEWKKGQNSALVSLDLRTGAWQWWLGPEGLLAEFGHYPLVAIIPKAEAAQGAD